MLEGVSEDLLPIGQFARLSRLSVKQLRHYDELGLLRPAHVDADTGYRYYHPEQARQALSIGLLRSMDVPLAVVGQVLSGTAGALAGVREHLEAELARRRATLSALERVMAEGLPTTPVHLTREPTTRAALLKRTAAGPQDIGRATSEAVAALLPHLTEVRLVGLFPLDFGDAIEITVAAVTDRPVPGAEPGVLPGGTFATATHVGPYDQISLTAHALLAWCAERRHLPRGPIREVYASDPASTPPERLVTHLMISVEET